MKKFFIKIFQNSRNIPTYRKVHCILLTSSALVTILDEGFLVYNRNLSKSVRIIAFIRCIFGLSALILANILVLIPNYKLRLWLWVLTFFYGYVFGGNFITAFSISTIPGM